MHLSACLACMRPAVQSPCGAPPIIYGKLCKVYTKYAKIYVSTFCVVCIISLHSLSNVGLHETSEERKVKLK